MDKTKDNYLPESSKSVSSSHKCHTFILELDHEFVRICFFWDEYVGFFFLPPLSCVVTPASGCIGLRCVFLCVFNFSQNWTTTLYNKNCFVFGFVVKKQRDKKCPCGHFVFCVSLVLIYCWKKMWAAWIKLYTYTGIHIPNSYTTQQNTLKYITIITLCIYPRPFGGRLSKAYIHCWKTKRCGPPKINNWGKKSVAKIGLHWSSLFFFVASCLLKSNATF